MHIIAQFPLPSQYDSYVELFGGAAHVLMQKKAYKHIECYNDLNGNLVNFWLQCRDNLELLEERCRSLPYSRDLYYQYHKSLWDGSELEGLERATRWFYVLRSSFSSHDRNTPSGWSAGTKDTTNCSAQAYHSAVDLFSQVSMRFRNVMIDNRDFEKVFRQYEKPRALYYLDPPYVDTEHYYSQAFTMDDHVRLAQLLNATSAYIALSYYPHPILDELYPTSHWRRVTWKMPKHAQRTKDTHDYGTEMLLLNYPPTARTLWDEEIAV
jgi:DNA adenine methylase